MNTECEHNATAERRRKKSNGAEVISLQCLSCGVQLRELSKNGRNAEALEWFDETIQERLNAERDERRAQLEKEHQEKSGQWWNDYQAYLQSDHWQKVRAIVLERDGICQCCLVNPAEQAHHLSYETYKKCGFSFAAECVGVCVECHDQITKASS